MDFIAPLLAWIEAHPTWAGLLVLAIAFSESLALVGLFLPGAAMMFGIGALVGTGTLELWPTLAWAAAGAIAGDGVSFWLGRHFHGHLRAMWPFRTHPELIENATGFFQRHGGKSVLLGRFVGPIRPVIPAVAGMMDMPAGRFFAVNVVSGVLWAPVYVLPGMLFATTLGLAAEVATRLAVLGGFLLALLIAVAWLVKRLFSWLHPKAHAMIAGALAWSRRHPYAGRLPVALLDPAHPEGKALTSLAALLLFATAAFVIIVEAVGERGLLGNLDLYVFNTLQNLRTPAMDRLQVVITELGDGRVLLTLFLGVLAWLLFRRHLSAAAHWTAAGAFAVAASYGLKAITALARPTDLYAGVTAYAFPSAHAVQSTVLFGFLVVLVGREVTERVRWPLYASAAILVALIGFSRLYLGAHWLSDVLGGLTLGLAWVAFLGIAYRRHPAGHLSPGSLGLVALALFAVAAGWNIGSRFEADLARYARTPASETMALTHWQRGGWQALPAFRAELRDVRRHPLTVQFAGALDTLRERLLEVGWRTPPPLTGLSWLRWLNSVAPLESVPVLPQVHNGLNERLLLTRPGPSASCPLLALRLWRSGIRLTPAGIPLWEGNVTCLVASDLPGLTVPRTGSEFDRPLQLMQKSLDHAGIAYRKVARPIEKPGWSGGVLLVGK